VAAERQLADLQPRLVELQSFAEVKEARNGELRQALARANDASLAAAATRVAEAATLDARLQEAAAVLEESRAATAAAREEGQASRREVSALQSALRQLQADTQAKVEALQAAVDRTAQQRDAATQVSEQLVAAVESCVVQVVGSVAGDATAAAGSMTDPHAALGAANQQCRHLLDQLKSHALPLLPHRSASSSTSMASANLSALQQRLACLSALLSVSLPAVVGCGTRAAAQVSDWEAAAAQCAKLLQGAIDAHATLSVAKEARTGDSPAGLATSPSTHASSSSSCAVPSPAPRSSSSSPSPRLQQLRCLCERVLQVVRVQVRSGQALSLQLTEADEEVQRLKTELHALQQVRAAAVP
jgi:hypothetical protein